MAYKSCPDCGERVYDLGCTWCNEPAYIERQAAEDYDSVEYACRGCMGPCGRCHEAPQAAAAVDPHVDSTGKPPTRVEGS